MNYYKAIIQYAGADYSGFQWQKESTAIQNILNESLQSLLEGKFTTTGASRTDAGVHAVHQVLKISTEDQIDVNNFVNRFNEILPVSIRCLEISLCDWSFNPAYDSVNKEYQYYFTNIAKKEMAEDLFFANNPFELKFELMQKALEMVCGKHSFHNFYTVGSNVSNTEREIYFCDIQHVTPDLPSLFILPTSCYRIRIRGNGFLKQMIRHLVAAIWLVGAGKISLVEFESLLKETNRSKTSWRIAPACGLYLYDIVYDSPL